MYLLSSSLCLKRLISSQRHSDGPSVHKSFCTFVFKKEIILKPENFLSQVTCNISGDTDKGMIKRLQIVGCVVAELSKR